MESFTQSLRQHTNKKCNLEIFIVVNYEWSLNLEIIILPLFSKNTKVVFFFKKKEKCMYYTRGNVIVMVMLLFDAADMSSQLQSNPRSSACPEPRRQFKIIEKDRIRTIFG